MVTFLSLRYNTQLSWFKGRKFVLAPNSLHGLLVGRQKWHGGKTCWTAAHITVARKQTGKRGDFWGHTPGDQCLLTRFHLLTTKLAINSPVFLIIMFPWFNHISKLHLCVREALRAHLDMNYNRFLLEYTVVLTRKEKHTELHNIP